MLSHKTDAAKRRSSPRNIEGDFASFGVRSIIDSQKTIHMVQMIEDAVTLKPVHGITNFVPILNNRRNGTKKKAMKRSREGKNGSSSEHKEKMRRSTSRRREKYGSSA
ncbi:uncharacterized protein [Coffea arabica]|uniref:Uncharacterized protein n=1 Tax=Coffea arabica TaxID=13443 RepID=A0ABM4WY09_COFAR